LSPCQRTSGDTAMHPNMALAVYGLGSTGNYPQLYGEYISHPKSKYKWCRNKTREEKSPTLIWRW